MPASPERALFDRFRMIEPLLALLPPEEQEVFEQRFGMEVLRCGKVTAVLLLIIGGTNVFHVVSGRGISFDDFLLLPTGLSRSPGNESLVPPELPRALVRRPLVPLRTGLALTELVRTGG